MKMRIDKWPKNSDFAAVWAEVKPLSEIGRWAKQQFKPFLAAHTKELVNYFNLQQVVQEKWRSQPEQMKQLEKVFTGLRDQRLLVQKLSSHIPDDIDLFALKTLTNQIIQIQQLGRQLALSSVLAYQQESVIEVYKLLSVGQHGRSSFFLSDEYDSKLAVLRKKLQQATATRVQYIQQKLKPYQKLLGRRVGEMFTVSRFQEALIAQLKADANLRIKTENFSAVTFQLNYDQQYLQLRQDCEKIARQLAECQQQVRQKLGQELAVYLPCLRQALQEVGKLDLLLAQVRLAQRWQGVVPEFIAENELILEEGRHPLLEQRFKKQGKQFTPRSISLRPGVTLLTGANMGGKTITLRLLALLVRMVHYGLMVPAKSFKLRLRTFIYYSAQEQNQEQKGLSQFGWEVYGLQQAIEHRSEYGLILIDEIAHGTNPVEGAAIAQAVIEFLRDSLCWIVVTTHYTQLVQCSGINQWRVRGLKVEALLKANILQSGYQVGVLEKYMDYRLEPLQQQRGNKHEALCVAQALGLEPKVLARARQLIEQQLS